MPPVKKTKAKKVKTVEQQENEAEPVISGQLSKKLVRAKKRVQRKERGVVLIKHLPHGFFETQLKNYFEQFGAVTRLRLVRSRRTGGPKGFAFVEFEYPEVAQVAAETMDNYLMFQKLVKATYIPPDKQLYNYFKTTVRQIRDKAGKKKFVSSKTAAIQRQVKQHNEWDEVTTKKSRAANIKKIKQLNKKFAHLGVDFADVILGPKTLDSVDFKNPAEDQEDETAAKKLKLQMGTKKKKISS